MPRKGGPIASRIAACQSDPLSQVWWPKILNARFSKALPTMITQTTRNTYSASAQRLSKSVFVHSDKLIKFSSSRSFHSRSVHKIGKASCRENVCQYV